MIQASRTVDVLILGAGGAGMMCATHAAARGRKTLLLDHSTKLGGKILISGGGRCNFTNTGASPAQYVSRNPDFCKSALARYPSATFVELVKKHKIPFHEKKLGQLFCDGSAQAIVQLLKSECETAGAEFLLDTKIERVEKLETESPRFAVHTSRGEFRAHSLVVATGGLSIPKIGATGLGYELASQWGLNLIERAPALDGFAFTPEQSRTYHDLAGVALDSTITCNGITFRENILFTHTGLSGPASLQASLHWYPGDPITINLLPDRDALQWVLQKKREGRRTFMKAIVSEVLPARVAARMCEAHFPSEKPIQQESQKNLEAFAKILNSWTLTPAGTVGYSKAEVTRGGVDTDELSSQTLESTKIPGLHFIGEVVDVTGWLGGYNFQWAWASGHAAGIVV